MSFSKPIEPPKGVELKNNMDGTENAKYIDLLDEDKSIAGQQFVCLSFISPEDILKQKEKYFFEKFLKIYGKIYTILKFCFF